MKSPPLNEHYLNKILSLFNSKNDCVFLETSKTDGDNFCSYIFYDPIEVLRYNKNQVNDFFIQAQNYLDKGFYLAGWFSYEFGFALEPIFEKIFNSLDETSLVTVGVFNKPIVFDHSTSSFSEPLPSISSDSNTTDTFSINNVHPSISKEEYLNGLDIIKEYIKAGDTYQVNYTLKLYFDFEGSPSELFKMLRLNQPVSYSAFIKLADTTILSFSPELFFRKTAENCIVKPMKGTISRGSTWEEDLEQVNTLHNDSKNRSENVMIVDLLRNDLGRLSQKGSVKMTSMFDVETYATLHQMTSTISGKLRPHTCLADFFTAFFPCGSVTGAPKIRTMEIIDEIEKQPRGVYTGGIGFMGPEQMTFNVPIRTLVINQGQSEMGIGSGIVYDSNHEDEWQECLLKAKFLTSPNRDFQLIETLLWTSTRGFYLLDKHIDRLKNSAAYFDFVFDQQSIIQKLNNFQKEHCGENLAIRVRLLLSRNGDIGLSSTKSNIPGSPEFPPIQPFNKDKLPAITICKKQVISLSPFLYHKTTNRQIYDSEREKALNSDYFEVVFENEKGEITEGSISSIFIRRNKNYYTPPIKSGLLPGTFRADLLERFPDQIREKTLFKKDLQNADAIFLTNSVRGITQVKLLN